MSQIGSLSGSENQVVFEVTDNVIRTFQGFTWTTKARYGTHARYQNDGLTERTGTDPDTISLPIQLRQTLGVDPLEEYTTLLKMARTGEVLRLLIGSHAYGLFRWTIQSCQLNVTNVDAAGVILDATATVKLLAYAYR
mgnify:CR=1 FL=1